MASKGITEVELPIEGMDCGDCALKVRSALEALPGVMDVKVSLLAERAILRIYEGSFDFEAARSAVASAGYSVPEPASWSSGVEPFLVRHYPKAIAGVFLSVVLLVLAEVSGFRARVNAAVPWSLWLAFVVALGYPSFLAVARAALRRRVISHSLMSLGVLASALVGEWVAALLIVAFMRIGSYIEGASVERARKALKGLALLLPGVARVQRGHEEVEIALESVAPGDLVVVRSGERVPVDGVVVFGHAAVDQSSITGEAMPVDVGPGGWVYASSLVHGGMLKVRARRVGEETALGNMLRLVQEAETRRGTVAAWADRFSGYYLPILALVGLLALVVRRDPVAVAAIFAVACSCSLALAVPLAQLAAIGAAARRGIAVRGGRYLELLAKAEVLLIDKTGTLTFGRPTVVEVIPFGDVEPRELLALAASAERYSSHPLARAVVDAALREGVSLLEPEVFSEIPGVGVTATVDGREVRVGRAVNPADLPNTVQESIDRWETTGKTPVLVWVDGDLVGVLAAVDDLRPEVPEQIQVLKAMGLEACIVTGDRDSVAALVAREVGAEYVADLLPEEKVQLVRGYQARGKIVAMVGDGANDAAALTQADIGIAIAGSGVAVASEAAPVVLMREDWRSVPYLFRLARRSRATVRVNLVFTALYNLLGVGLAFWGLLPPTVAAAAQSLPDVVILANSSRLLQGQPRPRIGL